MYDKEYLLKQKCGAAHNHTLRFTQPNSANWTVFAERRLSPMLVMATHSYRNRCQTKTFLIFLIMTFGVGLFKLSHTFLNRLFFILALDRILFSTHGSISSTSKTTTTDK
jgi:hypothetical protein